MQSDPNPVFQSPDPQLPPYFQTPVPDSTGSSTPPIKGSKKRKLSSFADAGQAYDGLDDLDGESGLQRNGSSRKSRQSGTKRACNQCRQQKLKCNVVEDPWQSCDRCTKHNFKCEITADFKRVGKRSQQAELEKSNQELAERVVELNRELEMFRQREAEQRLYEHQLRRQLEERSLAVEFTTDTPPRQDDGSHDAALLLNLKQSASDGNRTTPMGRITPLGAVGGARRLGTISLPNEMIERLWEEYFAYYHAFLPVLEPTTDTPEHVYGRSSFLFWTVVIVAARHFEDDKGLFSRLSGPYNELVKETIIKPPIKGGHHVVKGLCLLCTWPMPISSTTDDMTFTLSGVMMKFAMHLGIHRPSSPADFSNIPVSLRAEQITDRLKTWAVCNLVAQNVSTGYGQPPETVYDATLQQQSDESSQALMQLRPRLEVEKFVDKVTRELYCPQEENVKTQHTVHMLKSMLKQLQENTDFSKPLDLVYFYAAQMHLNLQVFFEDPSPRYQLALEELHQTIHHFLKAATSCGTDLCYAPYYLYQMIVAAAAALLKLMNSFFGFAEFVDRDAGVILFWSTINEIRTMSVRQNDLPVRIAEVLAQMWNAWDTAHAEGGQISESVTNGEVDSSLTLKRRYRMSQSHVFDSLWRWKEEMHGDRNKLKETLKNPTSPIAMTHRSSSFSNGRRPSTSLMDENQADAQGMTSFGGFGGVPLAGQPDMAYATSYDFFDPMGWYLNDLGGMPEAFGAQNGLGW